jgi:chemosensory pili system protein ChpA (sensor histidine kinase/response regulator)
MLPEMSQDRSALRWIRGELDQTLRETRTALENFVEGESDRLDQCVEQLHHVHGALEMAQVYGAAMLADEMEQLALVLSQGQAKEVEPAAEALMLGVVQLPAYLEKVEGGGADIPLVLLPLMNDLRAAREAPLVTETSLFAPKLDAVIAAETVRPGSGNRELPELIRGHRSYFHRALLHWIRGHDVAVSLRQIRDVLDTLNSAAGTARLRRLLDAAEALAAALLDDDEAPGLAVKPLFGKLDRVFKQVIDQGEESAMLDFPVDLLKNLLYYVARSNSKDPAVLAVKRAADLVNTFPEQSKDAVGLDSLGAPDRELFQAVGEALAQDLRDVKDQLDLFIRSDRSQLHRLTGLADPIQRIGDTLGMVGRGGLRARLKHRCEELREIEGSGQPPTDESLMVLAADLLSVESSLSSLATRDNLGEGSETPEQGALSQSLSDGELQQHVRSAIDEALVELAKTKDAILEYLDSPGQAGQLSEVPAHMQKIAGVLHMLGLPEAGKLLHDLSPYIEKLSGGAAPVPNSEQRDAIADVVISAELYMQSAIEQGGDRSRLLSYAESALQRLGLREMPGDHGSGVQELGAESVESTAPLAESESAETQQAPLAQNEDVTEGAEESVVTEPPRDAGPEEDPAASASAEMAPDDLIDDEILQIFIEEAQEELESIESQYPRWRENPEDREALLTVRRSFHTLKGSGRIVGANNIGEFAWAIENLLNRLIDGTVPASPQLLELMEEVLSVLPTLVEESGRLGTQGTDVTALSERAFALVSGAAGQEPVAQSLPGPTPEAEQADQAASTLPDIAEGESSIVEALAAHGATEQAPPMEAAGDTTQSPVELAKPGDAVTEDSGDQPVGKQSAGKEVSGEGKVVDEPYRSTEPVEHEAATNDGESQRAHHREAMTGQSSDAEAEEELDALPSAGPDVVDQPPLPPAEGHDSEFTEFDSVSADSTDSSLNAVFLNEAQGHLSVLAGFINHCREHPDSCRFDEAVQRATHTLHGSSRAAEISSMAELAAALEELGNVTHGLDRGPDAAMLTLLERSHRMLSDMAASVERPQDEVQGWEELRDEIRELADQLTHQMPAFEAGVDEEIDQGELDPELVEIFLDEAKELLESLESELSDWQRAVDDRQLVAQLQRTLHTMKGGARLAGVMAVGDLSHAMESVFESVVEKRLDDSDRLKGLVRHAADALAQDIDQVMRGALPVADVAMIERLEAAARGRDWQDIAPIETPMEPVLPVREMSPSSGTEAGLALAPAPLLAQGDPEPIALDRGAPDSELLTDSHLLTDSELLVDSALPVDDVLGKEVGPIGAVVDSDATLVQFPGASQVPEDEGFVPRAPLPEDFPVTSGGGERVRVASEALDHMVNNAGEVSIYRARIEQQNSSIAFNLGELNQTIDRLRGQLRNLELETEAQILSRHEREGEAQADFDPLELDRYSLMQQLSRALSETVEDLSNLGLSLSDLSRDTDTLLLQQARVTTDLQDALLRTRMVKFSSRVPRLERVVRQTAHGLGKQANFDVTGGEEDMDRAILERMMSPLEHLLRNAVSHGIEDVGTREAKGKSSQGLISLRLAREGTDVVLTLSDDGAGLDRERIRAKAIERGLLDADASIEDEDLYQLILQPGFSTAQVLSQVSGRGVGMDVVLTEVKQLGGALEIDSQQGHGTSFTIRLPFTLAITDALLVALGEDIYAVPHSSMDGVARISVDDLRAIYASGSETFEYGGRDYNVRYLGSMLGAQPPHIVEGARWLALLLVRSGEHRVAIQVDGLLGNRQIVVKSIGAQLSTVRWFTGGTILADGQIALILDTNSLVRIDSTQQPVMRAEATEPVNKGVSVMVVDDSITVRKVTSRLLERHNMQVVTAKDGVDAVTLLQEYQPDVMLLDIEMPRMDGYELARHMRSTPELSAIPIIMITSRTGDKHRSRALELGVKRYLGKPYQEAELLENIYTVLADIAL